VNYWKSLHKKAKEREEKLKKELQEKEGKIRDLTNLVNQMKKVIPARMKEDQNHQNPSAHEVNNQVKKVMDAPQNLICR